MAIQLHFTFTIQNILGRNIWRPLVYALHKQVGPSNCSSPWTQKPVLPAPTSIRSSQYEAMEIIDTAAGLKTNKLLCDKKVSFKAIKFTLELLDEKVFEIF